ncbi:MAG: hypothetical protein EXR71_07325 [Myxococcales bacterium]|nr:hypothetical protein [Myxococcales bacterium]
MGAGLIALLLGLGQAAESDAETVPVDAHAPSAVHDTSNETPEQWATNLMHWSGRLVAYVTISAPRGGLGRETLDPLLRMGQGALFLPMDVRQDVATIFRSGEFSQVEAWVEPWPVKLANGDDTEGVRVEYRVWATPKITRLTVVGVRAFEARDLLGPIGLVEGEVWERDEPTRWEGLLETAYRLRGWPAADVVVARTWDDEGDAVVVVTVSEGAPQLVREIKVRPNEAVSDGEARGILAQHGLSVGKPWTDAALRAAQEALTERLHTWPQAFLWWRRAWWPEARVNLKLGAHPDGGDRLSVLIEPRRPWTIGYSDPVERPRLPTETALVSAMALDDGARLGRGFAEEAGTRLSAEAASAGWLEAKIEVTVAETDRAVRLGIDGKRGPRNALRGVRVEGDPVDPDVIGASSRGGFSGCVAQPARPEETGAVAAERRRTERFLCQATAESAAEKLVKPAFSRQTITPEAADRAAADIEEFYRAQGYPNVSVTRVGWTLASQPVAQRRDVDITYRVVAGPRASVVRVDVRGGAPGVVGRVLFSDLVGRPLNPNTLAERARRVVETHREEGFLHADAKVDTSLDASGEHADVVVTVVPGPVVLVRSVQITGHGRTLRQTIEGPVDVHPGDPVSPTQLAAIRRSLYELGVFSRVSVEPVGDEDRVKDVLITVQEKRNLAFDVGGGVATDNGAALFARASHRNLWGRAHRLTLYGQAGIGWIGDTWSPDWLAPEWKAALRYEAPDLPTAGERVSVDVLLNEEQQERSYRLRRSGGGAGVQLKLGGYATAELGYRAQLRQLLDVDPGVLVVDDAWETELGVVDGAEPEPVLPSGGRWASGIEASLVLDFRDDAHSATRGGLGAVSLRVNDDLVSDIAFVKADGSWTQLVPAAGLGLVLRLRGGAALVPNEGVNLPVEDRFRAGGGGSFRGFDIDQIGPANYVIAERVDWPEALQPLLDYSQRDAAGRWVTTGGDAMAVGAVELDVPFSKFGLPGWSAWQFAIFTDIGNVWWVTPAVTTDSAARGSDPWVRWGTGVGIRRSTPIGPLQLDLGFNPLPLAYRDEPAFRVHFAVGAI